MTSTIEKEQSWRLAITNSNNGYLDTDEIETRFRVALVRKETFQKHIQAHIAAGKESNYTASGIASFKEHIAELDRYMQFLINEIANFPPLPVLPPPQPLIKISGVIEEVTFTKAMACFDAEAYSTVQEELEQKRNRDNMGAVFAMLAQAMNDSPIHARVNDGKANKLKCLYVEGKVSGKSFSGWFGMTNIRVGDYVEMAVMSKGDRYLAYAIINTTLATISMTPKCCEGKSLHTFTYIALFSFFVVLIPFLYPLLYTSSFPKALCTYIIVSLGVSVGLYKKTYSKQGVHFELYGRIAKALNFPKGESFDLLTHAGKISKKKREAGEIPPREEGQPPMPQGSVKGKNYHLEFFYYY